MNNEEMDTQQVEMDISLKKKLEDIGFEKVEFESKSNNRFIVQMEGIPSYLITGIDLPTYSLEHWTGGLRKEVTKTWGGFNLTLYNPIDLHLERELLKPTHEKTHNVVVKILDPVGEVVTKWEISAKLQEIDFGKLKWGEYGEPNTIRLYFLVENVEIK